MDFLMEALVCVWFSRVERLGWRGRAEGIMKECRKEKGPEVAPETCIIN